MERYALINKLIDNYFRTNPKAYKIAAKDLMPEFIAAGIFEKDHRGGLPIRKILRRLNNNEELDLIPYVHPERKTKNTYWYFVKNKT